MTGTRAPILLVPPVYFVVALSLMFLMHRSLPSPALPGALCQSLGFLSAGCGLGLACWAAARFWVHKTNIRPFQEARTLIQTGPYRFTRNPLYISLTLLLLAAAFLLGTPLPFLVVPVFPGLIEHHFIRAEERMLESQFGEEYRSYCRRVPRWLELPSAILPAAWR